MRLIPSQPTLEVGETEAQSGQGVCQASHRWQVPELGFVCLSFPLRPGPRCEGQGPCSQSSNTVPWAALTGQEAGVLLPIFGLLGAECECAPSALDYPCVPCGGGGVDS